MDRKSIGRVVGGGKALTYVSVVGMTVVDEGRFVLPMAALLALLVAASLWVFPRRPFLRVRDETKAGTRDRLWVLGFDDNGDHTPKRPSDPE